MLRSILVPLDGSKFGEHALPMALSIARRAKATVHLVHVHQVIPPTAIAGVSVLSDLDQRFREDEQNYLDNLAKKIQEGRPVEMETVLLEGDAVPALQQYALENEIDLIVMSTHGRGAISRFWLGSIADEVVHEMTQPVLLIRPEDEQTPDLTKEVDLKTILIPSDGTLRSEEVLGPTLELAKLFNSNLDLLRVIKPVLRPSYMPDGATISGLDQGVIDEIHSLQSKQETRAKTYLDEVSTELKEQGFQVQTAVLVEEQPALGIEMEARSKKVDLIAMETHARKGLDRLIRGSVADKIVRDGFAPVLLHHQPR